MPPENRIPLPLPPLPACGERGAEGGVWGPVRGLHPRLLNSLPCGERPSNYGLRMTAGPLEDVAQGRIGGRGPGARGWGWGEHKG